MLAYRYPIIAREGWVWIAIIFVAAVVAQLTLGKISITLWCLTIVLIFLFRDPSRVVPSSPLGVVCPVDGKIVAIEEVHDGYQDRCAICISIRMRITSVYSVHSPMEGKIMEQWLETPRKIQPAITGKSQLSVTTDIMTYAQWVQSDEGDDMVLVMEAGNPLSQPRCYGHSGERIGQGQRCGFLRFGAQVDVLLPASTRIEVKVGEDVIGGSELIGTLVREASVQQESMGAIES